MFRHHVYSHYITSKYKYFMSFNGVHVANSPLCPCFFCHPLLSFWCEGAAMCGWCACMCGLSSSSSSCMLLSSALVHALFGHAVLATMASLLVLVHACFESLPPWLVNAHSILIRLPASGCLPSTACPQLPASDCLSSWSNFVRMQSGSHPRTTF